MDRRVGWGRVDATHRRVAGLALATLVVAALATLEAQLAAFVPVVLLYLPPLAVVGWHGSLAGTAALFLMAVPVPLLLAHGPLSLLAEIFLGHQTLAAVPRALPVEAGAAADESVLGAAIVRGLIFGAVMLGARYAHARWRRVVDSSLSDPLTGIGNRARFVGALGAELARQRRYGGPLSVLCIDVDGFKRINDCRGHAAGDAVLVGLAAELVHGLRREDVVARLGGDEFAVLLIGAGAAEARAARTNLQARLARWARQEDLPIGFSVGTANSTDSQPMPAAALLAAADATMYPEKRDHHRSPDPGPPGLLGTG